jgi:hypothetical protein
MAVVLLIGAVMITYALAFISSLSQPEFITLILAGSLLVILGGLIHLYQYRLRQELRKGIQAIAERALEATVENSNKVIESELQRPQETVAKENGSGTTS